MDNKYSEAIDMWDRKVKYGIKDYKNGIILFRFVKSRGTHGSYFTEQKIHIDKKMIGTIRGWLNAQID